MTKYKKKPIEVEAWQVGSDEPMPEDMRKDCAFNGDYMAYYVDGCGYASNGDWIIRDYEWYSIADNDIFEQTYEVVEDD